MNYGWWLGSEEYWGWGAKRPDGTVQVVNVNT